MKFLSDRMTSASGSIGGTTFSHNRGGLYTRARRIPVNRRTVGQIDARNRLSNLMSLYRTLSPADQALWQIWAENVTTTGALGTAIKLTGQTWFVKMMTIRLQSGLPLFNVPPPTFGLSNLTAPVPTITPGGATCSIAYTNTDDWAIANGGGLLVYASRPQNFTKNFFAGPYQFCGVVLGNTAVPPTSPATLTLPFTSGSGGTKQFFRFVASDTYGAPSPVIRASAVVAGTLGPIVLSVVRTDATHAEWTFNVPVTTDLGAAALKINGASSTATAQTGAQIITGTYAADPAGQPWEVDTDTSAHLTPPPAFPQTGLVS